MKVFFPWERAQDVVHTTNVSLLSLYLTIAVRLSTQPQALCVEADDKTVAEREIIDAMWLAVIKL